MKLSVISPTFNEAANVQSLIGQIGTALSGSDFEILIVDDNSPDRTWAVAEDLAKTNPRVRVIRRMEDPGLGPAVVAGFAAAEGDSLACIDADLQHDPSILPKMVDELTSGAEVVVGSRYVDGGGTGTWSPLRRFESWSATKVAQIFLGVKLKDPMSGYFVMRREDFNSIRSGLNASGFKILLEILAKLHSQKVKEVPYTFRVRTAGESKLSSKVVWQFAKQVWRLSKPGQICPARFLKFALVGGAGVIVNLAVLAVLFKIAGLHDWRASALASVAANASNYVFNNVWTFADRIHKGWSVIQGYILYFLMSLFGLAVSTASYAGLIWCFGRFSATGAGHAVLSTSTILICQAAGIVAGTIFNYELNKNVTWRSNTAKLDKLELFPRQGAGH